VFDDTLRQGLSVELQQSPFLSVISDQRVQQTLARMGQPKETRLTSELAQEICERTASVVVLEGSIAPLGSQFVLGLRAKNCNTGSILDQEQIQAARREESNSLSELFVSSELGWVNHSLQWKAFDAACRWTTFARGPKGLQHRPETEPNSGTAAAIPLFRRTPISPCTCAFGA
jgi:folate-dependent phosphoribosylglycinamide formyltransferase PurN